MNKMDAKNKFRLRTFLYYLMVEPWSEKVSLPNFRTLNIILLCLSLLYKWKWVMFISLFLTVLFHLISEYKSGKHIHWYRERKYPEQRKALKEVREERNEIKSS